MWVELVSAGILAGQWIYHRLTDEKPPKPKPADRVTLPRLDEGAPIPLIYGRCRVRAPIFAWGSTPEAGLITNGGAGGFYSTIPTDTFGYSMAILLNLGVPFINGTNKIHALYIGDRQLQLFPATHFGVSADQVDSLTELIGDGGFEDNTRQAWLGTPTFIDNGNNTTREDETGMWIEGRVEFLNGNWEQLLVAGGAPFTHAAEVMVDRGVDVTLIPGYRGVMSIFLMGPQPGAPIGDEQLFHIGLSPSAPALSVEASSYPEGTGLAGNRMVGQEANPADVAYDLMTGKRGKLGIPHANMDVASFEAAGETLLAEGHGYSHAIEDTRPAREILDDVLKQIDGMIRDDPATGKLSLKLIRNDFDVLSLPHITPDNCEGLFDVSLGGETNLINKVRVVFEDRQERYRDNSAVAHNQANAVGMDNQVNEAVLQMPGIKTVILAETVAGRELSFRSRSLKKCRAIVDRSFLRVLGGDVVRVTWPEYGWSHVIFRVGNAVRGPLDDGKIELWLLQEPSFEHRGTTISLEIPPLIPSRD